MKNPELKRAIFLDLEYTCWADNKPPEGQHREIIQIGVVEVNYTTLQITREMQFWVVPEFPISDFCTQFTGIDLKKIKANNGQSLDDALAAVAKHFGHRTKVAYTWGYDDENVLSELCDPGWDSLGYEHPFYIIDLAQVFHQTFQVFKAMSLDKALDYLGLKFEGEMHTAVVDAKNLARLHMKMIDILRDASTACRSSSASDFVESWLPERFWNLDHDPYRK